MSRESTPPSAGRARQGLPLSDVVITDAFWERRRAVNREETLENQLSKLDGRIENLRRAGGLAEGGFEGPYHNDPPVYKWIEAACYELEWASDPALREQVDEVVEVVAAAQQDDGYLHSNFVLDYDPDDRFTNLHTKHELFALGHLAEAAVAHHRATGDDTLLEAAMRFADLACETFGPDGEVGYPGHPETELALVGLYRETDEQRYLDLAEFFVNERGRANSRFAREIENEEAVAGGIHEELYCDDGEYDGRYAQDHLPVREQDTVEGHAVKATFLYAGMADVAAETGDESLLDALETLWSNMTERRLYVTGAIGARGHGEAFGADFELPNESAYAETCAAFGNIIWNQRMLGLTGEGRFADLVERTLYNGFLAGVSLDGTQFCYTNPLQSTDDERHRQPWYHTSCCPPNVARLLSSLGRYVYSKGEECFAIDQFVSSRVETAVAGVDVTVAMDSDLPWAGDVSLSVEPTEPTAFELAVRIPEWADNATLTVDGERIDLDTATTDGYARVERTWDDSELHLSLPMEPSRSVAHPDVDDDAGRVAITRGPLVYCFEEIDNERPPHHLSLDTDFDATARFEDDVLEGVCCIDGTATAPVMNGWEDELYRDITEVATEPVEATAVPYYAWDNRAPGRMQVWVRSERPTE